MSTHKEDMPDEYNQPEMDEEHIKKWAASIGENTAEVIDRIFRSVTIKEQGYNSALLLDQQQILFRCYVEKSDCKSG